MSGGSRSLPVPWTVCEKLARSSKGRIRRRFFRQLQQLSAKAGFASAEMAWLARCRPDVVMVSVSWHLDDLPIAHACAALKIPYVLLVQSASPHDWVRARSYASQRRAFAKASACYFVSSLNREIVGSNLALDFSRAKIVDNAFNVAVDAAPQWPDEKTWKLACVGRINFQSKGQDLLINVLKQKKWRARPLQVSLWGVDEGNLRQTKDLIDLHNLGDAIKVRGFADDIVTIWAESHGLVLPSRYEGNPLAMIEAMICGRMPIVTDVGRARELVDDNETGFIATAATTDWLDEAMERAWNRRHDWQAMGAMAKSAIKRRHSMRPAEDFADAIVESFIWVFRKQRNWFARSLKACSVSETESIGQSREF